MLVARCGHNRNTCRKTVFGPASLGGHSFRHTHYEQGMNQIQWFLQHWRIPGQLQDSLHVAASWCQASIGFGVSFLTDAHSPAPHFESAFLKSIREFLKHINGRFELDCDHVPPTQRMNDSCLMQTAVEKMTDAKEIILTNCARVCLKIVTVSDVTNAAGDTLDMNLCNDAGDVRTSK